MGVERLEAGEHVPEDRLLHPRRSVRTSPVHVQRAGGGRGARSVRTGSAGPSRFLVPTPALGLLAVGIAIGMGAAALSRHNSRVSASVVYALIVAVFSAWLTMQRQRALRSAARERALHMGDPAGARLGVDPVPADPWSLRDRSAVSRRFVTSVPFRSVSG